MAICESTFTMLLMECGVCKKHKTLETLPGGPIYDGPLLFVAHFPDLEQEPAHFGHVIIELKRHITTPRAMTQEEAAQLGIWIQKISTGLENFLGAEHTYVARIGDKTPHLHFHLIPRFTNTPEKEWGPLLFRWPQGRKASAKEMVEITNLLRSL